MRAVVDANVWISAVLSARGFPARVRDGLTTGMFSPVLSDELRLEFLDRVTDPRFVARHGLLLQSANEVVRYMQALGEAYVLPTDIPTICRDPGDDYLIALPVAAHADCLVTGDKDLLGDDAVRGYLREHQVDLVTVRDFAERLDLPTPS